MQRWCNMRVYIFENDNYYIGECEEVFKKAKNYEDIELKKGDNIKIKNGKVEMSVDDEQRITE